MDAFKTKARLKRCSIERKLCNDNSVINFQFGLENFSRFSPLDLKNFVVFQIIEVDFFSEFSLSPSTFKKAAPLDCKAFSLLHHKQIKIIGSARVKIPICLNLLKARQRHKELLLLDQFKKLFSQSFSIFLQQFNSSNLT